MYWWWHLWSCPNTKQTFYINLYEIRILEGMVPAAHHLFLRDEAEVCWSYICYCTTSPAMPPPTTGQGRHDCGKIIYIEKGK